MSLLALLRGETASVREEIFAGSTWHAAYEPQRAVRTERHKYIRRWGDRHTPVLPNTDDGPSKDLLLRYGWAEREIPAEQLYDLVFDPNEANNLARDPACAAIARGPARAPARHWMRDTEDPLAGRPRRPPAGRRDQPARSAFTPRPDGPDRVAQRLDMHRAAPWRAVSAPSDTL